MVLRLRRRRVPDVRHACPGPHGYPGKEREIVSAITDWVLGKAPPRRDRAVELTFSELVRLLERNGFKLVKEKGSIRYYGKSGVDRLIRVDYHGSKEVPTGTCHAILRAAGLRDKGGA